MWPSTRLVLRYTSIPVPHRTFVGAERPGLPAVSATADAATADRARGAGGAAPLPAAHLGDSAAPALREPLRDTPAEARGLGPRTKAVLHRVVLVDDHAILRWGLCRLFDSEPDFAVCGEAGTVDEGFQAVERLAPDLLVTDLTLDGRSGLELTAQVHRYHPGLPVVVLSMHDEALFGPRALAAGARGYVRKRQAEHDLIPAARAVLAGQTFAGGAVGPLAAGETADPVSALSDREFEVFLLLGQGFAPRHIAETLCLSVSTVEAYRERMKEKLGMASSPALLRFAVRWCKDRTE